MWESEALSSNIRRTRRRGAAMRNINRQCAMRLVEVSHTIFPVTLLLLDIRLLAFQASLLEGDDKSNYTHSCCVAYNGSLCGTA